MPKPTSYLDEVDPNNMPQAFATYTSGRHPHFKLHMRLGDATAACANNERHGALLFERQGALWVQLARFEQNFSARPDETLVSDMCDKCGGTTVYVDPRDQVPRIKAKQVFARNGSGRIEKPLRVETLCSHCIYVY